MSRLQEQQAELYPAATDDKMIPPDAPRSMAKRAGTTIAAEPPLCRGFDRGPSTVLINKGQRSDQNETFKIIERLYLV